MNIEKVTGFCFVGTGVLTVAGFLIHPHNYSTDVQFWWLVGHSMIFLGLILNLIGLAWLYSIERSHLGMLGLVGFIAAGIGLGHYVGKLYWSGLLYPLVLQAHPEFIEAIGLGPGSSPKAEIVKIVYFSGAILFAVGYLAFVSALLRARRYPTVPLLFLMSGAIMVGIWPSMPGLLQMLSPIVSLIYTIGLVWIGVLLIRRK